jgi:hypothetical protein
VATQSALDLTKAYLYLYKVQVFFERVALMLFLEPISMSLSSKEKNSHKAGSHKAGSHKAGSHKAGSHKAGSHKSGSHKAGSHKSKSAFKSTPG